MKFWDVDIVEQSVPPFVLGKILQIPMILRQAFFDLTDCSVRVADALWLDGKHSAGINSFEVTGITVSVHHRIHVGGKQIRDLKDLLVELEQRQVSAVFDRESVYLSNGVELITVGNRIEDVRLGTQLLRSPIVKSPHASLLIVEAEKGKRGQEH